MAHINKHYKICYRVYQCVWGITNVVLLCLYKFAREFKIILFPLDKIFELIPWNDYNFSMVIEAMLGYDMRNPLDIMLLKWSKNRRLHNFLQSSN